MSAAKKGKFRHYDENSLKTAVEEVKNGHKLREVCRRYGVPKSTVLDRIKGRISENCKRMGPDPVLTSEHEDELCNWIVDLAKCGFPLKKSELLLSVQKIVKEENLKTPFKNNRPGESWYAGFLRRHPNIVLKNGEALEKYRAQVTEEYIRSWFQGLETYLAVSNALDILNNPSRILNADETGFSLCPKTGKVLGVKGKSLHIVKRGCEKENLTVLVTFTADGRLCPPVVVFPYVKPPKVLVNSVPADWILGKSESGWMRSDIFYEFVANGLNNWLEKENIQRPVLFVVDGHKSHMSLELSKFCDDNGIILYALPPNATHLLQPADVAVFKPLKEYWRQEVRAWQAENVNKVLTKYQFCPILKKVFQIPKLTTYFRNGFKACGLYPFDPNKVDYSKCVQNLLENRNRDTFPEKYDAEITEEDIKITEKVILKIRPELEEKGIDTDFILTSVKSLCLEENGLFFSDEDINKMEIIFEGELLQDSEVLAVNENSQTPKIVVLENLLLTPDKEEELNKRETDERSTTEEQKKFDGIEKPKEKAFLSEELSIVRKTEDEGKFTLTDEIEREGLLDKKEVDNCETADKENVDNSEKTKTEEIQKEGRETEKEVATEVATLEGRVHFGIESSKTSQLDAGSAFKKHLLFPKPIEKTANKRKRERFPSAISSQAWRKHYEEKEVAKENKNNITRKKSNKKKPLVAANSDITETKKDKQLCGVCEEELESDTEIEDEKNVGCDMCSRWFHLGCTKFVGLTYNEVAKVDYICDFCED